MSHVTNASETLMSQSAGTSSVLATDSQFEIKRYGNSGIHTVEGNVAGPRAARLTKAREAEQKEHDKKRKAIEKQHRGNKVLRVDDKFNSQTDTSTSKFIERTTGLVSAEDFKKIQSELMEGETDEMIQAREERKERKRQRKKLEKKKKKEKARSQLSFGEDLVEVFDEENAEMPADVEKVMKNPSVETNFLPDREREYRMQEQKANLAKEWNAQQEEVKKEMLEVTYSYWDGSGHRREITLNKGITIGKFLEAVRQELLKEFPELRSTSADSLLYVKEDLIIPHNFSFYDLIVTKARGKSGPLFHFDVHDDLRLLGDARVEKDESHPGKVVERRWYDRNKHIFPASRWEIYDPSVTFDKYTIHGGEIMSKK